MAHRNPDSGRGSLPENNIKQNHCRNHRTAKPQNQRRRSHIKISFLWHHFGFGKRFN